MKIIIGMVIGMMLVLSVGCDANKVNTIDSAQNSEDNQNITQEIDSGAEHAEAQSDFIDFAQKKNWEMAYVYMRMLGNPIKEVSNNYLSWQFLSGMGGEIYYEDPDTGIGIGIIATKPVYDYKGKDLDGDEICGAFFGEMQFFFPDSIWPTSLLETDEYISSYLGLNFILYPNDEGEGYWRILDLAQNNCKITLWTEDEIIKPESTIHVYGDYETVI